jgi:hypothetical protein
MSYEIAFPPAIRQGGRLFFIRDQIENHKLALAGLPPRPPSGVIELVPAGQVAREFGFHRRTLGRRVLASEHSVSDAGRRSSPVRIRPSQPGLVDRR